MTPEEYALIYASLGWYVVPVLGKRPVGDAWQTTATNNQVKIPRLFSVHHDGVGVQLFQSGIVDFDCDSEEAEATLQKLFNGKTPKTPCFQSAKGKHRLFKTANLPASDKIRFVIDGLEIRTGAGDKGAQTVFPPSGGRTWITDPECPLAEIPAKVLERLHTRFSEIHKRKELKAQDGFISSPFYGDGESLDVPKWLAKHGREIIGRTDGSNGTTRWHIVCPNIDLHTTADSFRDCCITQDPDGTLGGCCFHSSCGMTSWEVLRDAIGGLEYSDFHEPEPLVDLSGFMVEPRIKKKEPVNPEGMTDLFYQVPGLIGDMIAFHRKYAPRPRPELSLAASIALMGAITGRKIQTRSGMRTNVYCVGLAPSGSGKEKPRNNNVMALIDAGINDLLGSENPASDAALIEELSEHPAKLIQIDEVSRYFSTLKNAGGNSTHLKNIFTRFLELTGQAENPAWTPKGYADKRKSKTICHPHLCIYGTSTADGFWSSVASSDAVDGFLARMMVIEADRTYPRLRDVETASTPQTVIDVLQDWHKFNPPSGNLGQQFPRAMIVHVDSAAEDRIKSHSDGIEDRLTDEPDDQKAIWSRASALAKRLSLIFAASRGPDGIAVTLDDATAAVRLANWCTRLLIRRVFTHVASNEADSDKKKVLEIIRRAKQISATDLTRKTQWIKNRRARAEIVDELIEGGFITRDVQSPPEWGGHATNVFSIV